MPDQVFGLAAGVELQQLANGVVDGNVRGPAVGRRDGGIECRVRVGEPTAGLFAGGGEILR